ncbi:MAG: sulfite exporter TauE/SafE family protein [candidate division WOR-3 bacterium]
MTIALKILLLGLATILSFWISAICGGGASLILIPVLNLVLAPAFVPFSLTIGTFSSSASRIIVFKKHISWKIFGWFVPFSIPAVLLGAWLMKFVNPLYLEIFVALFLIANLPELFINRKKQEEEEKPYPNYILGVVGFFAGFVSGITGAIGLLFNRFYLRYGLTKEQIVATRAANEIFLHTVKLIVYFVLGLYSKSAIIFGIVIAFAAILSSYSVKFILPHISEFLFRKIGYGAMVISGIFLLVNTSQSIIQQDKISFATNKYNETVMNWRESAFVLEFSIRDGLEIERQIKPNELPYNLKAKYDELIVKYDNIFLEVVYRIGSKAGYEFYCYKDNLLTKIEFDE